MIQIDNITFKYRSKSLPVLENFSLDIDNGGIIGLLGKNGAGKSTLLYLIAGLLFPQRGEVWFNNENPAKRYPETLRQMFMVPEEFNLPDLSLKNYVKANRKFYPRFSDADLKKNLEIFELESDLRLKQLSMGQKKKAFLSFALACNTSLLLLDEPTNGLDIPGKSQFRKFIISSINDERTIIISTHQVRDIDRILDHILIVDNNNVLFNQKVTDILSHLRFIESNSKDLIDRAYYSQATAGGMNLILPNDNEEDTILNLELLFDFAITGKDKLQSIFTKNIHHGK